MSEGQTHFAILGGVFAVVGIVWLFVSPAVLPAWLRSGRRRLFGILALALAALFTWAATTTPPPKRPPSRAARALGATDTASHKTLMIDVPRGATLEVLDFGGSGQPVVLLAGLGNSGHVFDDLAPLLTSRAHVYAITRRGFGASSAPEDGYDIATRVADDLAVLDALKLERPVLVGHSIAGAEITSLAGEHPQRVRALVYLDAMGDEESMDPALMAKLPPIPPPAPTTPADEVSAETVRSYLERLLGPTFPIGEILSMATFGPDGKYVADRGRPDAGSKMIAGSVRPDYTKVACPALSLYVTYPSIQVALGSQWERLDANGRAGWVALQPEIRAAEAALRTRVASELKGLRMVEYADSHHYVFIRDQPKVVADITTFLAAL